MMLAISRNFSRIEGTSEDVDEEQFEPSAYAYDAGHDTIEHGSQYEH